MDMKTYWKGLRPDQKTDLADRCETSAAYLSQIANGHRQASPGMAKRIERETGRSVARWGLRPDVWDPPTDRAA